MRVVTAAARHGVSTQLADALAAAGLALPVSAHRQLTADARAQIAQGMKIKRLTLNAVDALVAAGIIPIMLKGYGLSSRLFPEQPLARPSSDVDLLVRRDELPSVARALQSLGLKERADEGLADVFEEHHHVSFAGNAGLVEAHFRLFSGFGGGLFDDASIRGRAREGSLDGRSVRWLSPEDEFCYLATHAANHGFLRASWLLDLARYLSVHPELPWERMAAQTRAAGFFEPVALSLLLLEDALNVTVPSVAKTVFATDSRRRRVHRRLFSTGHLESADLAEHRVWGFALRLWLVDSPRQALSHVTHGVRRLARRAWATR